jgi:phospholipid/cholesterol/gamma-HCH transport system substrate-binding protein
MARYNGRMQATWKVGLLVIVFVGLLLATYAVLQRSAFAKETDDYYVEFANAGGIQAGAPVLLAGVRIGSVTKVELVTVGKARATIAIERGHQIPVGSRAVLPTSFLTIGDRQIEIVPPSDAERAAMLKPGDTIPGTLASPMQNIFPDSEKTIAELNATLVSFRELLEDEELRGGLKSLMATSEETVARFGGLAERMDTVISQNSKSLDTLLATTAVSLENLQAVTYEIRELVESGQIQDRTVALLDSLNTAVESGQKLIAELNSLASDPTMRTNLQETLANMRTMSESGTRIATSAEAMAENGVVVSDEAVKLAKKANELAVKVDELIETFKQTLQRFAPGAAALGTGVEFSADLVRESDPGRFRTDINVAVPLGREKLTLGLYDAAESNKLNAQFIRAIRGGMDLRYGVYASKPGIGVDYAFAPRLNFRADLFGLNDPQLDLRMAYRFDQGFSAWLGLERLFQRPAPALGFGIRK